MCGGWCSAVLCLCMPGRSSTICWQGIPFHTELLFHGTHPPFEAVVEGTHLSSQHLGGWGRESSVQSQPETHCKILSLEKIRVSLAYFCGSISGSPLDPIIYTVTSPQSYRLLHYNCVEFWNWFIAIFIFKIVLYIPMSCLSRKSF